MTATAKAIMKRSVSSISSSTTTITATTAAESSSSSIINNKRKKYKMPANINTTSIEDNNDSSLNILIVDDNPINIHILKKSLSKLLNTTTIKRLEEANNGIEALNLLNQYHFDIIFLDIDMPILNGIDTTKCIRKKGQKTPIIAVTTNDSIESRDNYIKIGMNDCLSKPVDINLLEQALYNVLLLLPQQRQDIIIPITPPLSSSCSTLPPSPEEEDALVKVEQTGKRV